MRLRMSLTSTSSFGILMVMDFDMKFTLASW